MNNPPSRSTSYPGVIDIALPNTCKIDAIGANDIHDWLDKWEKTKTITILLDNNCTAFYRVNI